MSIFDSSNGSIYHRLAICMKSAKTKQYTKSHKRHLMYGAFVFLLIASLVLLLAQQQYLLAKSETDRALANRAVVVQGRVESLIKQCQGATKTLAFVVEKYGKPADFDRIAKALLEAGPYLSAIELLEEGTITAVFPLKGNEKVLGYDVFADSTRSTEALKAVYDKSFYIGGPLELKQGGLAVVGRYPIFRESEYLGIAAAVIRFKDLIRAAGMKHQVGGDFLYQFSKIDPDNGIETYFLPELSEDLFENKLTVHISDGNWNLHIVPANPARFFDNWAVLLFGLLSALLSAYIIVQILDEPGRLSLLIAQKTADLKEIAWMQSHQVRAPLARIMALAELLSPEHFDPIKDKEIVEALKKSSEELDLTIRDIVKRTENQA